MHRLHRRGLCLRLLFLSDISTSLCVVRGLGRQRRLHDDGGQLSQVLTVGRLRGDDGLGAVHPGRGYAVEVSFGLLPAAQLSVVFLFDVLLRH